MWVRRRSCEGDGTIVEASYRHGRSANWITEPAVSPDGKQVVYADGNGLFVLTLPE